MELAPPAGTGGQDIEGEQPSSYEVTFRPTGWCAFDAQADRPTDQSQGTKPVTPRVRPAHQGTERILLSQTPAPVDPSMSYPFGTMEG